MSHFIQNNHNLKKYNSWHVGGDAEYFAEPQSEDELRECLKWADQEKQPITLISGGSNILVSDQGIKGLVIYLRALTGLEVIRAQDHLKVVTGAGTPKAELLRVFLQYKLSPALFLAGLPGDMGGGVVMNAGVSEARVPKEFCEIVDWVEIMRGPEQNFKIERVSANKIKWTYRKSKGWQPGVITKVAVTWPNHPDENMIKEVHKATRLRLSKQPLTEPSCGSVFKNPSKEKSSGFLIEKCGLKGYQVGGAQVSLKHANFIINKGTATAHEIDQIIKHIQKTVKAKTKFELTTEVVYLGEWKALGSLK